MRGMSEPRDLFTAGCGSKHGEGDTSMQSTFVAILLFVGLIALVLVVQHFMLRRAVKQILDTFRRHGAHQTGSAKTLEELGLGPKSFMARMTTLRDYKPAALKVLIQREIIATTDEGKLYLKEENLNAAFREKT
jgi:hypothetical protein